MIKSHDESVLHVQNKKGESPLDIIKKNLDVVKKLKNKSSEVYHEEIMDYLKNPQKAPFNLEHIMRKGTVL